MLTKNFVTLYKALALRAGTGDANYINLKKKSGKTEQTMDKAIEGIRTFPSTTAMVPPERTSSCVLALGTGTREASIDDYDMEAEITEGLEILSQVTAYTTDLAGEFATITRVVKNTTDQPIAINEVGVFARGFENSWNNDTGVFLIAREKLKKQRVIPGGGKQPFTITLCIG